MLNKVYMKGVIKSRGARAGFYGPPLTPTSGLGLTLAFRNLFIDTHGRTPWMSDQLIARPLPTQDNTNIE
jgi:hypothetical protein